jgi:hypothetical protein
MALTETKSRYYARAGGPPVNNRWIKYAKENRSVTHLNIYFYDYMGYLHDYICLEARALGYKE